MDRSPTDMLRAAIFGPSSSFCHGDGKTLPSPVSLRFADGSVHPVAPAVTMGSQAAANAEIAARCHRASFGEGKATRKDKRVRDALQLDAGKGAFEVVGFDPAASGVLADVASHMGLASDVWTAELQALNVYGKGGHFVPHQDTPRGADMVGSLVVCLPSRFHGGELGMTHRGQFTKLDWGAEIEHYADPRRIRWVVFYGDVLHEVGPVWSGSRVTLSYTLRRRAGAARAREEATDTLQAQWSEVLADPTFLKAGGTLGIPCFHMYSQDERILGKSVPVSDALLPILKGRDRRVAQAARDLGLGVTLQPYLVENTAGDTWRLAEYPGEGDLECLDDQLDPDTVAEEVGDGSPLLEGSDGDVVWIVPPPSLDQLDRRALAKTPSGRQKPSSNEMPAFEFVGESEYSRTGYFGNEGGISEFYVYAALHVEVPRAAKRRIRRQ